MNVKMRKSIHVSSKPVAEVLSILLAESSVAYKMCIRDSVGASHLYYIGTDYRISVCIFYDTRNLFNMLLYDGS